MPVKRLFLRARNLPEQKKKMLIWGITIAVGAGVVVWLAQDISGKLFSIEMNEVPGQQGIDFWNSN